MEFWGHMGAISHLLRSVRALPATAPSEAFPPAAEEASSSPHPRQPDHCLLMIAVLMAVTWSLTVVPLMCIFLVTNDAEHLCTYSLAT